MNELRVLLSAGLVLAGMASAAGAQTAPATAGPLFASDAPLELRLEGDLRTLLNDRDTLEATYHPFTLTWREADAAPVSLEVRVRTRGHWRRQRANCDFPPLLLDFPRSRVEGTLFAGQNRLKLVTPCRPGRGEYRQYVLREFLVYRAYNLLTPLSLRARLARTTYVDATGRSDSLTTHTFLLEDAERMAARNGGALLEVRGAEFHDVDSVQMGLVGLFLYMIGGTDWSLRGLHNIELVRDAARGVYYSVPYDFDWTGIVDARYATPDPRLGIRTVRQRLYRGRCLGEETWRRAAAPFRERKADLYALYERLPDLDPGYVRDTHAYLDDFYEVLDDPGKLNREIVRRCREREGI